MNHGHSYEVSGIKINNVKDGKKSRLETEYGQTHSYRSSAFGLSRFHCILRPRNIYITRLNPLPHNVAF